MTNPQTLPHCDSCGLQIVSTMYPLMLVDGQMIYSRHKEYPVKETLYVCTAQCQGKSYDDNGAMEALSIPIGAGSRGVIVEETAKIVKLKLLNGATVSVVQKVFAEKWRKE